MIWDATASISAACSLVKNENLPGWPGVACAAYAVASRNPAQFEASQPGLTPKADPIRKDRRDCFVIMLITPVLRYSGSTVAVFRGAEAEWLFKKKKP